MFFSPLEQFDAINFFNIYFKINNTFIDLSLTNILLPFIVLLLVVRFFLKSIIADFTIIPKFWQLAFERLFLFILNLIDQQIGPKGYSYVSFIFSLFTFILISNLLSLIPFGFALTSHIVMIFFLSLSIGIGTFITV